MSLFNISVFTWFIVFCFFLCPQLIGALAAESRVPKRYFLAKAVTKPVASMATNGGQGTPPMKVPLSLAAPWCNGQNSAAQVLQ